MMRIPRWLVSLTSVALAYYYLWVGAIWAAQYDEPLAGALMLTIYFFLVTLSMVAFRGMSIPRYLAFANFVAAILLPWMSALQLSTKYEGTFATWYIGALGLLLAATAIRGHHLMAWLGLGALLIHVVVWGGLEFFFHSGFIGALLFVAAGQGFSSGLEAAEERAIKYRALASQTAAATAETTASRTERQRLISQTLRGTLPTLTSIVEAKGDLTTAQRADATSLEADLRDQIRGRDILDRNVRAAILAARQRGVVVVVLDDGGLVNAEPEVIRAIRERICIELANVKSGRVTIRAVPGEAYLVTFVVTQPGVDKPDLWLTLP